MCLCNSLESQSLYLAFGAAFVPLPPAHFTPAIMLAVPVSNIPHGHCIKHCQCCSFLVLFLAVPNARLDRISGAKVEK